MQNCCVTQSSPCAHLIYVLTVVLAVTWVGLLSDLCTHPYITLPVVTRIRRLPDKPTHKATGSRCKNWQRYDAVSEGTNPSYAER